MQIVSLGDNLHEWQNLFSRMNKKHIISLSSDEFAHSIVMLAFDRNAVYKRA